MPKIRTSKTHRYKIMKVTLINNLGIRYWIYSKKRGLIYYLFPFTYQCSLSTIENALECLNGYIKLDGGDAEPKRDITIKKETIDL